MLEVRNITKSYGEGRTRVTALDNVSFTLGKGKLLAILGPSGSGKTTLVSIIAGLLGPTSGEIMIGGHAVHLRTAAQAARFRREKVGLVFQDHHLVPYLTARENLLLVPHLSGRVTRTHRQLADTLLADFDLTARAAHKPSLLSGGERQRVAIARALMNAPEIMLVDEPTSSLDTERGLQVVELLKAQVHERAMTCLMVTHDPRMAAHADESLTLIDGRATR
ncbi:MAG: ABC transporter ATP-binding protein [Coriobacteriia bacterium]|nr:ABC transporter ATP-binding protein [Actinomycetota bacterium]MDZ4166349.1 ABC transporter ATP-binding protein [Coriobacteriia bacterium]